MIKLMWKSLQREFFFIFLFKVHLKEILSVIIRKTENFMSFGVSLRFQRKSMGE